MTIQQESKMICSEVFRLLREERERQGLSKYALANKTGLSQQAIGYVERGTISPALDTILRIARALNVDLGKIVRAAEQSAQISKTKKSK